MEQLSYYSELINLINEKGSEKEFIALYQKYFNKVPAQSVIDDFVAKAGQSNNDYAESESYVEPEVIQETESYDSYVEPESYDSYVEPESYNSYDES